MCLIVGHCSSEAALKASTPLLPQRSSHQAVSPWELSVQAAVKKNTLLRDPAESSRPHDNTMLCKHPEYFLTSQDSIHVVILVYRRESFRRQQFQ